MKKLLLILSLIIFPFTASASDTIPKTLHYKTLYQPAMPQMEFPTRVQITLPQIQKHDIAILENESQTFQPYASETIIDKTAVPAEIIETSPLISEKTKLIDNNLLTSAEFDLDQDSGHAYIIVKFNNIITSNSFSVNLSDNVALPNEIAVSAFINDKWKTVLAKAKTQNTTTNFVSTLSDQWKIELWHSQPLRLEEITIHNQNEIAVKTGQKIVWLAQPNSTYCNNFKHLGHYS